MAAVIGALRADLSAGWADFASDMGKAADSVKGFARTFRNVGADLRGVGATLSAAITLPVVAFGAATVTAGKDFESAMNRVKAATGAAGAELDALKKKARDIGKDSNNTATALDAANAMEILAKNGLTTTQIMAGALAATTKLSAATGSDLAGAGDVATDVMLNFGKAAADLDGVVDGVTGTLLASKFGFDDYRLALGQAGGVAGGLGVEFNEFNAVIAATSAAFSSGSDAGTSFKTFLVSLTGNSEEAKRAIAAYGLEFFDASGNMRSMADIAGELRTKLGGLSEEAKTEVLKKIFGTDAMRTAIGLMNQGREGIAALDAQIQAASAQEQMDARMGGLSGALKEFGKVLFELKLAIADSGLLGFLTDLVKGAADLLRSFSTLPPSVLAVAAGLAAVAAAIGPALFIVGAFVGAVGNLAPLAAGAGLALKGFAAVIFGPMALALRGLTPLVAALALQLSVTFPAATAVAVTAAGTLRAAMGFLLGPWGIAIAVISTAVILLANHMEKLPPPTRAAEAATTALGTATRVYADAAATAASATGEEAKAALIAAQRKRELALAARASAAAKLVEARATIALINAENMRRITAENQGSTRGDAAGFIPRNNGQRRQAESDAAAQQAAITASDTAIKAADKMIADAQAAANRPAPAAPPVTPARDISAGGRGRTGPTIAELERAAQIEAARLMNDWKRVDALEAADEIARRTDAYVDAGLSKTAAQAKAEGEVTNVVRLRAAEYARNIVAIADATRATVAELDENVSLARELENASAIKRQTLEYQREGLDLAEAERRAAWDIAQVEAARTRARERWLTIDGQNVALANARAAGNAAEVERLEREATVRERIKELMREGGMSEEAARIQSNAEQATLTLSAMAGKWREFSAAAARGDYARNLEELNRLLREGKLSADEYSAAVLSAQGTLHTALERASPEFKQWSSAVDAFGDSVMASLKPDADLGDIWAAFRMELLKILILQPLIDRMKNSLKGMGDAAKGDAAKGGGGSGGGGGGGGGSWWQTAINVGAQIFGGYRAKGGDVMGSKAYMVGERGPELFAPGVSGKIIPNDALTAGPARGMVISPTFNITADDAVMTGWVRREVQAGMAKAVQMAVPAAVEASIEAVPAELYRQQRDSF